MRGFPNLHQHLYIPILCLLLQWCIAQSQIATDTILQQSTPENNDNDQWNRQKMSTILNKEQLIYLLLTNNDPGRKQFNSEVKPNLRYLNNLIHNKNDVLSAENVIAEAFRKNLVINNFEIELYPWITLCVRNTLNENKERATLLLKKAILPTGTHFSAPTVDDVRRLEEIVGIKD